jgi:pescadillo protein
MLSEKKITIITGIYPREPRSRKKANRGSTAAASFYYQKDIAYLLHEPVLQKLREHKAFAKKLSRALGRKEDGLAKNLDSAHDGYRIDHIIKERHVYLLPKNLVAVVHRSILTTRLNS